MGQDVYSHVLPQMLEVVAERVQALILDNGCGRALPPLVKPTIQCDKHQIDLMTSTFFSDRKRLADRFVDHDVPVAASRQDIARPVT
jgi:hypothetical protein